MEHNAYHGLYTDSRLCSTKFHRSMFLTSLLYACWRMEITDFEYCKGKWTYIKSVFKWRLHAVEVWILDPNVITASNTVFLDKPSHSATLGISYLSWNPEVHYCVHTTQFHCLLWARQNCSTLPHHTYVRWILVESYLCLGLQSGLFPLAFQLEFFFYFSSVSLILQFKHISQCLIWSFRDF